MSDSRNRVERERWLPVVGYEGFYEVSDQGRRVRSLDRIIKDKTGRVRHWRGRVMKQKRNCSRGHMYVDLKVDAKCSSRSVHGLVAAAFLGPRPDGLQIRHLNGIPSDCRLVNLAYGTQSENMLDSVRHGTHFQARKTHCPQQHEYTPENTRIVVRSAGTPFRRCLICSREATRAWADRQRKRTEAA